MLEDYRDELMRLIEFANSVDFIKDKDVKNYLKDADENTIDEVIEYLTSLGYNIQEEDIESDEEPTELQMEESECFSDADDDINSVDDLNDEELKEFSEAIEMDITSGDFDEIMSANTSSDDPVKMYFREIGQIPRLTAQEEQTYAIDVQKGLAAKQRLQECEQKNIELKPEERGKLEDEVKRGMNAREIMIDSNYRLVVYIAKRYLGRGLPFLDLIQQGNCGLMKAVNKFDPTKGFKFATYATWWIRQSVTRALADQGRTIRIPVHMVETINKLSKVIRQLTAAKRREPTIEEIAEEMKISVEKVQQIQKIAQEPISIDMTVGDEDDSNYGDIIADTEMMNPFEYTENQALNEKLNQMLSNLTPREERVIRLRFGLDDNHIRTLEDVGKEFNVTRERIRQIEGNAIKRLQKINRKTGDLSQFKNRH